MRQSELFSAPLRKSPRWHLFHSLMLLIHYVLLFVSSFLLPPPQHTPRWPSSCVVSSDILQPNQFRRLSVASRGSWGPTRMVTTLRTRRIQTFGKKWQRSHKRNIKPTIFFTEHIRHHESLLAIVKWCKLIWFDHVTQHVTQYKTFLQGTLEVSWPHWTKEELSCKCKEVCF